jgi:hypothetical protein
MTKLPEWQLKKMIRAKGIDPALIDIKAHWDSSLSKKESFDIVRNVMKSAMKPNIEDIEFEPERYKTHMIRIGKKQTGKSNLRLDKKRKALPCGQRETMWGTTYSEHRKNRCDLRRGV